MHAQVLGHNARMRGIHRRIGIVEEGVLRRHLLPNLSTIILTYLTLTIPAVILDESFGFEPYGLMFRRNDPEFKRIVDETLLGPARDPFLQRLRAAHPELMRTVLLGKAGRAGPHPWARAARRPRETLPGLVARQ